MVDFRFDLKFPFPGADKAKQSQKGFFGNVAGLFDQFHFYLGFDRSDVVHNGRQSYVFM